LGQQFFVGPGTWNPQGDFDRVTGHLGSSFWKLIVPRCESAILSTRGTRHAFLVQSFFIGQPIPTFPNLGTVPGYQPGIQPQNTPNTGKPEPSFSVVSV
jgi:hypothetical protein